MHKKRNRIVVWKILNYSKYNFLLYQSKCSIKNISSQPGNASKFFLCLETVFHLRITTRKKGTAV